MSAPRITVRINAARHTIRVDDGPDLNLNAARTTAERRKVRATVTRQWALAHGLVV